MSPVGEWTSSLYVDKFFIGLNLNYFYRPVKIQPEFANGYRHLDALLKGGRNASGGRTNPGRAQSLKSSLPEMPGEKSADRRIYLAFVDKVSQKALLR